MSEKKKKKELRSELKKTAEGPDALAKLHDEDLEKYFHLVSYLIHACKSNEENVYILEQVNRIEMEKHKKNETQCSVEEEEIYACFRKHAIINKHVLPRLINFRKHQSSQTCCKSVISKCMTCSNSDNTCFKSDNNVLILQKQ